MKQLITILFFTFTLLASNLAFADASSACQPGNGALSKMEITECIQEHDKSSQMFKFIKIFVGKAEIGFAVNLVTNLMTMDFTSTTVDLEYKDDAATALFKAIDYVVNRISSVTFGIILCGVILMALIRGSREGVVLGANVLPFAAVSLILGIAVITGHFAFFIKVLFVIMFVMAFAIFFSTNIFSFFVNDLSGVETRLHKEADTFSEAAVYSMIEWHIEDIVARKGMLVETGNLEVTYQGIKLKDKEFVACLLKEQKKPTGKNSVKFYQAGDIEKTQYCASEELGYKTYKIGHIADKKTTNESSILMLKMMSMQPALRNIAYGIINNNCASVYNVDKDLIKDYISSCVDMKADGSFNISADGFVKTLQNSEIADVDVVQGQIQQQVDELAFSSFTEMLKNGNSVDKSVIESVKYDDMFSNFQLGSIYKKAYESTAMKAIDLEVVNEVAIKKSKLQQFFNLEDNLSIFDGQGSKNTFGLNEYYGSLKPQSNINSEMIALLDGVAGGALTDAGMQYKDCKQSGFCKSATANFVTPVFELGREIIPYVASVYTIAIVAETYWKTKFEAADQQDPNRPYYISNARFWHGFGMAALGIIGALGIATLFLIRVMFIDYFRLFAVGMLMPFLVPFTFGYALLMSTYKKMFRDDGESFTDMMKKYGVVDVMLRMPLVSIGSIIGLTTMMILMFIASILLSKLFGGFAIENSDAGTATLTLKALFFVFIYSISYMVSFFIGMKASFKATEAAINKFCYRADSYDDAIGQLMSKAKGFIGKLGR